MAGTTLFPVWLPFLSLIAMVSMVSPVDTKIETAVDSLMA
jgi:hypothetical protein